MPRTVLKYKFDIKLKQANCDAHALLYLTLTANLN